MHRFTPVPSSSPARCVSRGWISIRQQKCSAPLGAVRTHRFSGGLAPSRARSRRSASCSSAAPVGPVVLEARARAARREQQVERHARGVRRHQHGLVVDRDDPLAPADLLLHEVGEQVAAHRAHGVGAEALALAGDGGGHEVQRVQLRVGVRERRARLAALVDDQVPAGGVGVRAHALPPGRRRRAATCSADSSARCVTGSGALTITSCAPAAGWAVKRSGLASRSGVGALGIQRRDTGSGTTRTRHGVAVGGRPRAASGPRGRAGTGRVAGSIGVSGGTSKPPPGRSARSPAMIVFSPVAGRRGPGASAVR